MKQNKTPNAPPVLFSPQLTLFHPGLFLAGRDPGPGRALSWLLADDGL